MIPTSKVCTSCKINKSLEEYDNCLKGKYSKKSYCKTCTKRFRKASSEKITLYHKTYRELNKETLNKKGKIRLSKDREDLAEWYVRSLIISHLKTIVVDMKNFTIPQELIELKRKQLKLNSYHSA